MSDHLFFLVEGSGVVSEHHTIRDNDHFDVPPAGVEVVRGTGGSCCSKKLLLQQKVKFSSLN